MKLRRLLSASDSPRHRGAPLSPSLSVCDHQNLSATTKKPASSAGFRCFILSHLRLAIAFLSRSLSFPHYFCPKLDYSNSK